MTKLEQYEALRAQIRELTKQADALKAEIEAETKEVIPFKFDFGKTAKRHNGEVVAIYASYATKQYYTKPIYDSEGRLMGAKGHTLGAIKYFTELFREKDLPRQSKPGK